MYVCSRPFRRIWESLSGIGCPGRCGRAEHFVLNEIWDCSALGNGLRDGQSCYVMFSSRLEIFVVEKFVLQFWSLCVG